LKQTQVPSVNSIPPKRFQNLIGRSAPVIAACDVKNVGGRRGWRVNALTDVPARVQSYALEFAKTAGFGI
jgi:hypothetical protein